jgi:hypothetical protein
MIDIKRLNILCLEYIKEVSKRENYKNMSFDGTDKWSDRVIRDAFTEGGQVSGSLWKWLGGNENLLNMAGTYEALTTISHYYMSQRPINENHEKNYIYVGNSHTPEQLICLYAHAFVFFNKDKVNDYIEKHTSVRNNKRKRSDETPSDRFLSRLENKMVIDLQFHDWIHSGRCFSPVGIHEDHTSLSQCKLVRQTCEPVEWKVVNRCIDNCVTFTQLVKRFDYDMTWIDLTSVKTLIEQHYSNITCIEQRYHDIDNSDFIDLTESSVHSSDYNVTIPDTTMGLCPETPKKKRRSLRIASIGSGGSHI